ncbi:shikimate dehydrogenase family protein [Nesterenkonia halotolerans]|uniref:Shikimate dehydrogenase n=1 Tax=Nesterenkonia halotolerans TaxID=225325 RepID=A0ABR9J456_9MICC|nr:shikimate dehydrogenase [Nesterenkonia halotolerans]MBE1513771.1 shikimate dehydrogenase [Nesterenkonia halotolerans]
MRQAAVLGHPISHSQSPALHAAAYDHLGLDIEYRRIDVPLDAVDRFLHTEGAAPGWLGWSVTMPLKGAMAAAVEERSSRVQTLGVLNTVVHRPGDGHSPMLYGENTDVDGILHALIEAGLQPGLSPDARIFGIIGAGATATAALAAAAELGYTEVRCYARSIPRAAELHPVADALGLTLSVAPLETLNKDLQHGGSLDALVSTLPPRAADEIAQTLPALTHPVPLLDVAYDPWPSALADAWESAGGRVVSGLVMLLHQAVRQVELFTAATENPAAELSEDSHDQLVAKMRRSIGL